MSNYFESYSFEVGSTDNNTRKTKYNFSGPSEYIDKIAAKPVQITNSYDLDDWSVQSKGFGDGVLRTTAEKMIGTRTIKIDSVVSNKLPKFRVVELESDYDPHNPIGNIVSFVEVYDKKGNTDSQFTKLDEQQEKPYERRFSNSSIVSIRDFLRDKEFEKMLSKIGDAN
jgi:hypothetical protein